MGDRAETGRTVGGELDALGTPTFIRDPHVAAYAARGFVDTLTDSQREVLLSLFTVSRDREPTLAAILEQASFLQPDGGRDHRPALLSALDYALPRTSSAGSCVSCEIKTHWAGLGDTVRAAVKERVNVARNAGRAGMAMDRQMWAEIAALPVNEDERQDRSLF